MSGSERSQESVTLDTIKRSAVISDCGLYRYTLERSWGWDTRRVLFIGLNPSTADAHKDDPTLRRCIGFAKSWGYEGLILANLFAYRATRPKVMRAADDPIGPDNDYWLCRLADEAADAMTIACWGTDGGQRGVEVAGMLHKPRCLGHTQGGHPRHPLYVKSDTRLEWLSS